MDFTPDYSAMANKVIVKVLESNVALYIKTVVSCKTY